MTVQVRKPESHSGPRETGIRGSAADLAAQVAALAEQVARLTGALEAVRADAELIGAVYKAAYAEGAGGRDPLAAEARAQQARRQFGVVRGGTAATGGRPRKTPGGAA